MHASLVGTDSPDDHLEWNWHVECSCKNYETFKDMPNVFGIADGILIIRYYAYEIDHDRTLRLGMHIYCQENLQLNKKTCTKIPFLGKVISRKGVQQAPEKVWMQNEISP